MKEIITSITTRESATHEFTTWSDGSISIEDPLHQFEPTSHREHVNLGRQDFHVLVDLLFDNTTQH